MKRYRINRFDFDARATTLRMGTEEQKKVIIVSLIQEYGQVNINQKVQNFQDLGIYHPCVIAFHNRFIVQVRASFVIGAYYPALTGVCALGERVLNYLLTQLMGYFKSTNEYKNVYKYLTTSCDNWDLMISTLGQWNALLPSVVKKFYALEIIRNRKAVHFNRKTEAQAREFALEAIKLFSEIIFEQFGTFPNQPWFIYGSMEGFIKKEYEDNPFVKEIYLPSCQYVSPEHEVIFTNGAMQFVDNNSVEKRAVTDQEFIDLYHKWQARQRASSE